MKNPTPQLDFDDNEYFFYEFWRPEVVNGKVWHTSQAAPVYDNQVKQHWPARGGVLPGMVRDLVLSHEKSRDSALANIKDGDAQVLGWLPPPLVNEGRKVQTDWLYRFLLDPYPIRPAVVLRMPKFNMSHEESRTLVNYFAAIDNVDFPYEDVPPRDPGYLADHLQGNPDYLKNAFEIVADAKVCMQCHRLGNFAPKGSLRAQAPQLDQVYNRLRSDWTKDWLSAPKTQLPYTVMPNNFPHHKPNFQDRIPGPSEDQIQAVRALLLNYDRYIRSLEEVSMKDRIKVPPPEEGQNPPAAATGAAASGGD